MNDNTNHSNPHNLGPQTKKIELPTGEWNYYEAKTFSGSQDDYGMEAPLFSYTFKRDMDGRYPMTFTVKNFAEDLTWEESSPYGYYQIGKANFYRTRGKALSAIRRHFKSEEWEGQSGKQPAFAIYPDRDKEGNLKYSTKGAPFYNVAIDFDGIENPAN